MNLRTTVTSARLGTLVWGTVKLELTARVYDAGTREHTASKKGLDLVYDELDRREKDYTSQEYDIGLGPLLRGANTDLFENPNKGDPKTMAELIALNPKERALILELDGRERDYTGGASVDNPLGITLKRMHGAICMAVRNPCFKQLIGEMVGYYIRELNQIEELYRIKATALEQ